TATRTDAVVGTGAGAAAARQRLWLHYFRRRQRIEYCHHLGRWTRYAAGSEGAGLFAVAVVGFSGRGRKPWTAYTTLDHHDNLRNPRGGFDRQAIHWRDTARPAYRGDLFALYRNSLRDKSGIEPKRRPAIYSQRLSALT